MHQIVAQQPPQPRHVWEILPELVTAGIISADDARSIVMVRQDSARAALIDIQMACHDAAIAGAPLDPQRINDIIERRKVLDIL